MIHVSPSLRMRILYRDNHLIAVNKPAGMICQPDAMGATPVASVIQRWLQETLHKPGNAYVASLHRLDKPVSGALVFATTSKAAARMAEAFRERRVSKTYLAIVHGPLEHEQGVVKPTTAVDESELYWRRLRTVDQGTLLEVRIASGKRHQIRRQLAWGLHRPIVGDAAYGSPMRFDDDGAILLHAWRLEFAHPVHNHSAVSLQCLPPWLREEDVQRRQ